ncbi:MAG: carbohydrate-binding protein [Verrucomicrobiota bacterium JB022]|nr:carbohydrate-binding protein [Verrucomicrobiota bacterium JB022]
MNSKKLLPSLLALSLLPLGLQGQREMEKLDRGVVAVRTGSSATFISWRVLGLDASSTQYNLYRSTNGGPAVKLNGSPLQVSNYTDTSAPTSSAYTYTVRPVVGGVEQASSVPFTLSANGPYEPAVRIPVRNLPGYTVHFVWVGDLDGDGEYDYILDRLPSDTVNSQKLEAYTRTGELLWVVDLGPGSVAPNNIEPGPSAIDVGHWDGVTVYDLDGDGRAEVALRTANGVVFGDGSTLSGLGNNVQALSILNGLTGAERARATLPQDYLSDGPLAAHLGIGYLDGNAPSVVAKLKNRIGSGAFNLMVVAYDFEADNSLSQRWKWNRGSTDAPDFHQIRLFDVNGDGTDEFSDGGYVLNANGTFRYKTGGSSAGVVHGDRFHFGDLNPNRPGLEGFAIQQDNANGLHYLVFDASSGSPIHLHWGSPEDTARGVVADIDPNYPGYEYWSFHGYHRIDTGATVHATTPWPNFRIWWDGDLLSETLNDGKVEKYNASNHTISRLFTVGSTSSGVGGQTSHRGAPFFYGDILGDWREEIVSFNSNYTQLIICTTPTPTSTRLYTLAHNPAYRVDMTVKGYMQSHQPDYYLGTGMSTPPTPNIAYVPLTLQAELNTSVGGGAVVTNNRNHYTGTGFVDFNSSGGSVQWARVNGSGGGTKTLRFRYANGSAGTRTGQLTVNGSTQSISFPSTGGWTNWATLDVAVPLNPGAVNTVRVQSTGQDLANIDYLAIP